MSPDEYCQQKAAASGSSFYYSFLFLPPERRRAITALYAFCREVDDTVDECSDESLARIKLGLQDKLHQPWSDDRPRLFSRAELQELAGAGRRHVHADVARIGLAVPQGDAFLVQSPALLSVCLRMESAGIDLDVANRFIAFAQERIAEAR